MCILCFTVLYASYPSSHRQSTGLDGSQTQLSKGELGPLEVPAKERERRKRMDERDGEEDWGSVTDTRSTPAESKRGSRPALYM